jgi:AcrR family transcriptional regulator
MSDVKRRYRSPRRREQAEETRERILGAARSLFESNGYGGSTIESIAEEAGVAAQTVYATFGSKRGILLALLDALAAEANRPRMEAALVAAAGDPRRQLREVVAFTSRFYAAGAKLIDIARTVSGVEPDLRAMWTEGESRRHRAASSLVKEWEAAGVLAPGLGTGEASDVMWALSGPDVFRLLILERKWSRHRYEKWVRATLEGLLLGASPEG